MSLCPAGQNVIDDTLAGFGSGFIRLAEVGRSSTGIDELLSVAPRIFALCFKDRCLRRQANHSGFLVLFLLATREFEVTD